MWIFPLTGYSFNKITILTQPIGGRRGDGGHPAVTRSLLEGLKKLKFSYNYNPRHVKDVADVIFVLADTNALQQAINLKKNGTIKKIIAGPNIVMWPTDRGGIIADPAIVVYVVPSIPTMVAYLEIEPSLQSHTQVWFAGVDEKKWQPLKQKEKTNSVLVYWKTESESFYKKVVKLLQAYDWHVIPIRYGKYNHSDYKKVLSQASFAVFISRSESQGLALAEAWAMDVPTLCWNPRQRNARGREYSLVSSCPYLSVQTGYDWRDLADFERLLKSIPYYLKDFSPRAWVLEHMTDEASALRMLAIIESTFALYGD